MILILCNAFRDAPRDLLFYDLTYLERKIVQGAHTIFFMVLRTLKKSDNEKRCSTISLFRFSSINKIESYENETCLSFAIDKSNIFVSSF